MLALGVLRAGGSGVALVADGRWATDLAPKPNCYLSRELATQRVRELDERALRAGEVRTFRVHLAAAETHISADQPLQRIEDAGRRAAAAGPRYR